jgi:hypothetical protein
MHGFEFIGYFAGFLVFITFYMKTMVPLRLLGIASNITFFSYGLIIHAYPIVILHILLLPLNILRLLQVINLTNDVKNFSSSDFSMSWIIPYSTKQYFKQGDLIFSQGDIADKIYFILKGTVWINELDTHLNAGDVFGEVSIFLESKKRTFSISCETEVIVLSLTEDKLLQLYYQNPRIGFYLTKIIVNRLVQRK